MASALSRRDLAWETRERIIERMPLSTREIGIVLEAFELVVTETLTAGDHVRLSGFGTFSTRQRAARLGVNPRTLERVEIPAARVVKFTPGSELRAAVNRA